MKTISSYMVISAEKVGRQMLTDTTVIKLDSEVFVFFITSTIILTYFKLNLENISGIVNCQVRLYDTHIFYSAYK